MDQARKLRKILRRSRLLSPVSVLATLFMTACAVILVLQFAVNIYNVRGDGMQPSIHDGGIIITDSIAYKLRSPSRGDVVVAGGHVLRVIGLPDETITIHGGEVFMDGILLSEPYITASVQTWPVADQGTFILGTNEYFLLADDRGCYDDSRSGRVYTKEEILEKVIFGT